jgi:hypothetical protein
VERAGHGRLPGRPARDGDGAALFRPDGERQADRGFGLDGLSRPQRDAALSPGFTVYEALGQWRDPRTRIIGREPSRVVEIDAPDTRDLRDRIAAVRAEYKTRFHQQSVGLLTLPACGTF